MKNMSVHFMGIFILFYVGLEVTLGSKSSPSYAPIPQVFMSVIGWIVTYIIEVRGGGPSSGYVSAGFFGGQCSTLMQSVPLLNKPPTTQA